MDDSYEKIVIITPNDNANLSHIVNGILITTAGGLRITTAGGDTITVSGLSTGVIHRISARKVFSTLTTASGIFGFY